ncbi:hypothetical protein SmJEL517_g00858 [Synchytrium microbalum]|uniref:Gem-associated protein 2 n=1 Tax=Synchytrium microbalum TaxID=1806994 RepID=A0A507CC79_9FUNG|nr:uncharacterized protein SmJEL517_g00858 [Synchytrium microbalum]TPX37222.1 hypothetical protein SmJEL517_g00858 [Synchytrium microbalum]
MGKKRKREHYKHNEEPRRWTLLPTTDENGDPEAEDDLSGPPVDGFAKEAEGYADIMVAINLPQLQHQSLSDFSSNAMTHPGSALKPSEEWIDTFVSKFRVLRMGLAGTLPLQQTIELPHINNERAWRIYCYGPQAVHQRREESDQGSDNESTSSEDNAHEKSNGAEKQNTGTPANGVNGNTAKPLDEAEKLARVEGHPPLLPILASFNHASAWALLEYHISWLSVDCVDGRHGAWLFSLLALLDDVMVADEVSLLRDLCRKCRQIRDHLARQSADVTDRRVAAVNMVIAIVSGFFGQKDLGL